METLDQALLLIPSRRDLLNAIDDQLSKVIVHVDRTLGALKVAVPVSITYVTEDGHFFLDYSKRNGTWQITYGAEADDDPQKDVALVNAPRQVRAEVFTVFEGQTQCPIEQLIVAAAAALDEIAMERSPQLTRALHVVTVLEKAGFRTPRS